MATAAPRRIVAYGRVSRVMGREGDGYISPEVQLESIRRWAEYHGATIVDDFLDEDVSGGTAAEDRPELTKAFDLIEAGEADGIAVAKLNRFSRSTLSALADLKRLESLGGQFVSVDEQFDTSTAVGRFAMTMMLAVGSLELERLKESWQVAKERSIGRGALIGPTPVGYRRAGSGLIEPDPATAPAVRRAFALVADGNYDDAVAAIQEIQPTYTAWHLRRLLRRRVYLGEQRYGDLINRDAHEPMVEREVWERAQPGPERKTRSSARPFPLSHIAVCGKCGEKMVGGSAGANQRTYRCRASMRYWKGPKCSSPTVTILADTLEAHVLDELIDAYVAAAPHDRVVRGERAPELEPLHAELVAAEAERDRFAADPTAAELLGPAAWADALRARADRVTEAQTAYREAAHLSKRVDLGLSADELAALPLEKQAGVFASVFDAVVVGPARPNGKAVKIEDRVRFVRHGDAPALV